MAAEDTVVTWHLGHPILRKDLIYWAPRPIPAALAPGPQGKYGSSQFLRETEKDLMLAKIGLGCSSEVGSLPCTCKALGLMTQTVKIHTHTHKACHHYLKDFKPQKMLTNICMQ